MWSSWRLPTTYSRLLRLTTGRSAQGSSDCWSLLIRSAMEMRKKQRKTKQQEPEPKHVMPCWPETDSGVNSILWGLWTDNWLSADYLLSGSNNMPKFLQLCLLRALIILNAMVVASSHPACNSTPALSQTETWQSCSSVRSIVSFTLLLHSGCWLSFEAYSWGACKAWLFVRAFTIFSKIVSRL